MEDDVQNEPTVQNQTKRYTYNGQTSIHYLHRDMLLVGHIFAVLNA